MAQHLFNITPDFVHVAALVDVRLPLSGLLQFLSSVAIYYGKFAVSIADHEACNLLSWQQETYLPARKVRLESCCRAFLNTKCRKH
jgi:hypothetical protein